MVPSRQVTREGKIERVVVGSGVLDGMVVEEVRGMIANLLRGAVMVW